MDDRAYDGHGTLFEVRYDAIDATRDGTLGGPVDFNRRFVPGPPRYFINLAEVSEDEYRKRLSAYAEAFPNLPL